MKQKIQPHDPAAAVAGPEAGTGVRRDQRYAKVIELLERMPLGMTKFQLRQFVIGDQPLLLHQIRQAANEIDVREMTYHKYAYKLKRSQLELEIKQDALDTERSELGPKQIELRELEIEHETWKLASLRRSVASVEGEMQHLFELLEELLHGVDVDHLLENFDEYDRLYWSKRLGKQAAVDMASSGRVTAGNLSALQLLPEELREDAIAETVSLAGEINERIQRQLSAAAAAAEPADPALSGDARNLNQDPERSPRESRIGMQKRRAIQSQRLDRSLLE